MSKLGRIRIRVFRIIYFFEGWIRIRVNFTRIRNPGLIHGCEPALEQEVVLVLVPLQLRLQSATSPIRKG